MKFIDSIINKEIDNRIYWLYSPNIKECCYQLKYNDAIIKFKKVVILLRILLIITKKTYPKIFILIFPIHDINFYRTLTEIKDGLLINDNKIIFFDIPYVFVITDRKPSAVITYPFFVHYLQK